MYLCCLLLVTACHDILGWVLVGVLVFKFAVYCVVCCFAVRLFCVRTAVCFVWIVGYCCVLGGFVYEFMCCVVISGGFTGLMACGLFCGYC